jgi:DNA polymerase elongation subunit (family B)
MPRIRLGHTAPEAEAAPSTTPLKLRRVKLTTGAALTAPPPPEVPSAPPVDALVNIYVSGNALHLVGADGTVKRAPARLSCYVRSSELDDDTQRALRKSPSVLAMEREGEWTRIDWRDWDVRRKGCAWLLEKAKIQTYEGDVNAVTRYLVDHEPAIALPRAVYLDIEADSRVPFSQKEQARILCWVLVDEDCRVVAKGLLAEDTDESERELLVALWRALLPYQQIRSWSGDTYDFPMIVARSMKHRIAVQPKRWLYLDHLEQFERANKMAAESGDEKQSYALDAIAHAILGEGKHDFDASRTWEAWEAGGDERIRLLDYCVQDTMLMPRIEAETGYLALLGTIAEVCGVFPDSRATNPQYQVEALMMRLYKRRGLKPKTKVYNEGASDKFRGAYVMEPRGKGIQRDVHVCDFASMYPSIVISFNISPETKREKAKDPNDSRPHYLPRVPWDPEKAIPPGCALVPITCVPFDQSEQGILPEAIASMLELRKVWNKKKASFPPNSPEWKDADRRTTAYKIAANSFYGVVGAPTSRFFDRDAAESVSQAGAWLILETIKAAEARGMKAIYADTDSVFAIGCTVDEYARFVEWCNAELYPKLLAERGCAKNTVSLAYEKAFSRLTFVSAKRYTGRYLHYKGKAPKPDAKPEIRGLEYKRGDALKMTRDFQLEVILHVMQEDQDPDLDQAVAIVERWKTRVLDEPLELGDVVQSQGLAKPLNEYKAKEKKDGSMGAQPPHVMVAKELKKRGREVREGTKIFYLCVDGSSSPKKYIPAEDWDGTVDRYELWEGKVFPAAQRLLEAAFPKAGWEKWVKVRPPKVRGQSQAKARAAKAAEAGQTDLFAPLSARS